MQRRIAVEKRVDRARNIEELRLMAQRRLPNFIFEYVDSGAEDERTLAANRDVFRDWRFVPDALVDCEQRDLSTPILGKPSKSPLIVAPTGYNGMQRDKADLLLAKAAAHMGIPFTLSTVANSTLEDVRSTAPDARTWLQLYVMKDRAITENLLKRAQDSGCDTIAVTVDAVHYGNREWDRRCYRDGMSLNWRNKLDALMHPGWFFDVMVPNGVPTFANIAQYMPQGQSRAANGAIFVARQMDARLDWATLKWLRERWRGNFVVKGILSAADAQKALALGADGIVVTNHGGRQLDGTIASLDALVDIAPVCRGKMSVMVDSGFRRGTDIVKALCLGADAVMLGRAVLYGVAAGGAEGAMRALAILHAEIDRTLAQLGCRSIAELDRRHVRSVRHQ
jgi:(S)-mandelate dehydrogenase